MFIASCNGYYNLDSLTSRIPLTYTNTNNYKAKTETYSEFLSWTPEILLTDKTQTNIISAAAKHIRNSCSPMALQLTLQGAPVRTPL